MLTSRRYFKKKDIQRGEFLKLIWIDNVLDRLLNLKKCDIVYKIQMH